MRKRRLNQQQAQEPREYGACGRALGQRYPPIQTFNHLEDPSTPSKLSFQRLSYGCQSELQALHPSPKHIYRFWQIFIESVNPLLKVVHIPTLQRRIMDTVWEPGSASKPLTAIMFAIYTLAITTTSAQECLASFEETRDNLLARYRKATFQALMEAELFTTRDLEVLQAFVLFLFTEPDSDLTYTLTGAAIKIGQKMGLHRDKKDPKVSVFEQELRVRLWWQLNGIDSRTRSCTSSGVKPPPSESEFGDVRRPLNVNDADLHPDMTELPAEHDGPTEMFAVLMKFEIFNWYRASPTAANLFHALCQGPTRGPSRKLANVAIDELESVYEEKFLCHLDHSIPLHKMTHAMAKISTARIRFVVHHPRGLAAASDDELCLSQQESDVLFSSAVTWLEMVDVGMRSKFASHIVAHFTSNLTIDAYIYMISELRRRTSGHQVGIAWRLVEDLYTDHPRLIDEAENKFFASLGDLTLEAWESRRERLVGDNDVQAGDVTPQIIQTLWNKRRGGNQIVNQGPPIADAGYIDGLGLPVDLSLDLDYWNEFLHL